jgi:predicted PurR-regulated permease PerM
MCGMSADAQHTLSRPGATTAPAGPPVSDRQADAGPHDSGDRTSVGGDASPGARRAPSTMAPPLLRAASDWSLRILIVTAAVVLLGLLLARLQLIALAVFAALLISALLWPVTSRLRRAGASRGLAAAVTVLGLVLLLAGVGTLASRQAGHDITQLQTSVSGGVDKVQNWLVTGPASLDQQQIDRYRGQIRDAIRDNQSRLATGAVQGARTALEVLGGTVLVLFTTFFLLFDGERIWRWVLRLFSTHVRPEVDEAGTRAWRTLTGYIRGTILVATVDAVFIGLGLLLTGTPLVVPLALLTFLAAFIPLVGATVAGIAAVLVALVAKGPAVALIIAAVVMAVQQLEGHILQPLVLGRAVHLHPLAVAFGITAGSIIAGIPGAIVAVPLIAVITTVTTYFARVHRGEPADAAAAS